MDKKEIEKRINEEYLPIIIQKFSEKLGVKLPKKYYPKLIIDDKLGNSYSDYNNKIIGIYPSHLNNIEVWGEEISHYFRKYLRKSKGIEEKHSAEFFGYLGRRLTFEFLGKTYSPDKETKDLINPKKVLEVLKNNKKEKELDKRLKMFLEGNFTESIKPGKIGPKFCEIRYNILTHHRPYKFASEVDLNKIEDYGKLYRLPDKEVRRRFFREDKIYKKERKKRFLKNIFKGLEKKVSIFIIILGVLIGLTYKIISGNVINTPKESVRLSGMILFVIGIMLFIKCSILDYLKKNNKLKD